MADEVLRWDVINRLVDEMGYLKYLEIGVRKGACLTRVKAAAKDGVDPASPVVGIHAMRSDDFFAKSPGWYDIVFVDGDHRWPQALRDVFNSLAALRPGGVVLMHDCKAPIRERATIKRLSGHWNGTVWRAFAMLRMTRPDLEMWTLDADEGIGVVRPGCQQPYRMRADSELTHDFYVRNIKGILNLISVDRFFGEVVPRWKGASVVRTA